MGNGLLQVASTFTATPIGTALRTVVATADFAADVGFVMYSQMSEYMLRPTSSGDQLVGTIVLVRLEDWLRDDLKSSAPDSDHDALARRQLSARMDEFVNQLASLSQRGGQVWFIACPSRGWIATRHKLTVLCRTHTNVLLARVRKLPVTVLNCPSFLLNGECDDHSTDRLGQMPYTQAAFDQLGEFLAGEVSRTFRQSDSAPGPPPSDSTQFAAYLASLNVEVKLSGPEGPNRAHVERMLRTVAGFSLTGEKPYLSDGEIGQMMADRNCLLISVSDRLAEYGVSGFVLFREANRDLVVDEMALSCLVLGKQAEFAVLMALSHYAAERGLARLAFAFTASDRNQPMQEFLESIAFSQPSGGYVVSVADVEDQIGRAAVKPGAWTVTFQSIFGDSGLLP